MQRAFRSLVCCLALALPALGAISPALATDQAAELRLHKTIAEALQLQKAIEDQLAQRDAETRLDVEKLMRPAANDLKKARRAAAEGDTDSALKDAEEALRHLRKAETRLAPKGE